MTRQGCYSICAVSARTCGHAVLNIFGPLAWHNTTLYKHRPWHSRESARGLAWDSRTSSTLLFSSILGRREALLPRVNVALGVVVWHVQANLTWTHGRAGSNPIGLARSVLCGLRVFLHRIPQAFDFPEALREESLSIF